MLRANFNYIDDLGRAITGYAQWSKESRYLSELLSRIVHADMTLFDVSPLPQVLAALILAVTGIIIKKQFSSSEKTSVWQYAALIPLCFFPYYLEAISYKFDAPYIALSVFFSVAPIMYRKNRCYVYFIACMLGTMGMCMTYQASSGILPIIVAGVALRDWCKGVNRKRVMRSIFTAAGAYIVTMVFYYLLLVRPLNTYVDTSITQQNSMLADVAANWLKYYQTMFDDFRVEWLILIGAVLVCYVIALMFKTKRGWGATLVFALLAVAFMLLMVFGVYPLLNKPLYAPRSMYGMGVVITVFCIEIASSNRFVVGKTLCAALSWMFFVFAFAYGNALDYQQQYSEFRINMVANDLNDLEIMKTDTVKKLQLSGDMGYSPSIRQKPMDYQLLYRMIPSTLCGDWYWGAYRLVNYYGIPNVEWYIDADLVSEDLPVLVDSMYHTIRGDDSHIYIELK